MKPLIEQIHIESRKTYGSRKVVDELKSRGIGVGRDQVARMRKAAGFRSSMSRRGNCYDNAFAESLWGTLKTELVYQRKFATRLEAEAAIREYIEVFYNRIRRHASIGN
ncbi:MAG: integrase core domain-containing protein, partial [Dissulfuribacterales bacterium]